MYRVSQLNSGRYCSDREIDLWRCRFSEAARPVAEICSCKDTLSDASLQLKEACVKVSLRRLSGILEVFVGLLPRFLGGHFEATRN